MDTNSLKMSIDKPRFRTLFAKVILSTCVKRFRLVAKLAPIPRAAKIRFTLQGRKAAKRD